MSACIHAQNVLLDLQTLITITGNI